MNVIFITHPSSFILHPSDLAEGRGLEPLYAFARQFSRLLPHRFGLPSVFRENCEGGEDSKKSRFSSGFGGTLAGALRVELKTSVLETDILPIETTHPQRFGIWEFGFRIYFFASFQG